MSNDWIYGAVSWIYDHETLVTGMMATLAAFGTILAITCQIRQAYSLHQLETQRRHSAARAVMPLALSRMCAYSMACVLYAKALRENADTQRPMPTVSDGVISVLRDIVETTDGGIGIAVRSLVSRYQVQAAMLRDIAPEQRQLVAFDFEESIADAIFDATELYLHTSNFFKYSRFDSDAIPLEPTNEEIQGKLNFWGLNIDTEPAVWRRMAEPV
ncbi:hypothetical protein [Thalassospira sp. MCCC 1A03138]|uniref:hypothetical protein n=1 Tax=Thalassospira sp. MCCC 1A03138 TaxID=1470576 RepID=UPI000A1FAD5D|nr:hypothetical protein [Thalassospira sp. MCCC 1A03138]